MTALAIVVVVLGALALLRVGVSAIYNGEGLTVRANIGFVWLRVYPTKPKRRKRSKDTEKSAAATSSKPKREKKTMRERLVTLKSVVTDDKTTGSERDLRGLISGMLGVVGKLPRKLRIRRLTIYYIVGGSNAYSTAMNYGGASAGLAALQVIFEQAFHVKRYDMHTAADFTATKSRVYAHASISIAVWEIFAIAIGVLRVILRSRKTTETSNDK